MKKFQDSDYAVNKYSEGIVYRFADGYVEISLEEYLVDNPDKTERNFEELKVLSDNIYYEQDRADTRYYKRKSFIGNIEESERFTAVALDVDLIHKIDESKALKAAKLLLQGSELTEVQKRRFLRHFFSGLSYRQIAAEEGVFFTSVAESIKAAIGKLQKIYKIL